jgi:hypothetical protein
MLDMRDSAASSSTTLYKQAFGTLPKLLRFQGSSRRILLGRFGSGMVALQHAAQHPVKVCIVIASRAFVQYINFKASHEACESSDVRTRLPKFYASEDCTFSNGATLD